MKIRVTALLAAASAAVLAFGLAACSGSTSAPSASGAGAASGTIPLLRVGRPFYFPTLDETKNIGADNVAGLGLDTLLTYGQRGQLVPDRTWPSRSSTSRASSRRTLTPSRSR